MYVSYNYFLVLQSNSNVLTITTLQAGTAIMGDLGTKKHASAFGF